MGRRPPSLPPERLPPDRCNRRAVTGEPIGQRWSASGYARNARFVADLAAPLVELLAPVAGERILDLGCGDGVLTAAIAACGAHVVGIDASEEMVAAARARGVDARLMAGEALAFDGEFDAVFSNAALHWMADLDAVAAGVERALRPGGRFVGEMGGAGNVASVVAALDAALAGKGLQARPRWTFPEPAALSATLNRHGLEVQAMDLFARPTLLPGDIAGWLETFAGHYLAAIPGPDRESFLAEVGAALGPRLCSAAGWTLDYVRLRFQATRPDGRNSPAGER